MKEAHAIPICYRGIPAALRTSWSNDIPIEHSLGVETTVIRDVTASSPGLIMENKAIEKKRRKDRMMWGQWFSCC